MIGRGKKGSLEKSGSKRLVSLAEFEILLSILALKPIKIMRISTM